MFDPEKIRQDFPILKKKVNGYPLVYLDNAATSQKPVQVINCIKEFYEKYNANVHRGVHTLSEEASELFEQAHEKTGAFFNAKFEETIMVKNTTEALNITAYALKDFYKNKKKILLTRMEHHSNLVPWQQAAKRHGLKLEFVEMTPDLNLDYEDLEKKLDRKTAVIAFPHISNVLGTINNAKKIASMAKDFGVLTVLDASQSAPHMQVNFEKLGVDFMAVTGHKMLAPTGIGALIAKKELLEQIEPVFFGGEMILRVKYNKAEWNVLPWKFEAGTPNICGAIALAEAVKYLSKTGMHKIEKHSKKLGDYAHKKLLEIDGLKVFRPTENASGIVSFTVNGLHAHDLATILDQKGIAVRSGHHCAQPLMDTLDMNGTARASFYLYNTKQEVDFLVNEVLETAKHFR